MHSLERIKELKQTNKKQLSSVMENEIFIQDEWQVMQKAFLSKNFGATCLGLVFKWENGSVGPTEHSHKTCHSGMWYNMGNRGLKKKNHIWIDSSLWYYLGSSSLTDNRKNPLQKAFTPQRTSFLFPLTEKAEGDQHFPRCLQCSLKLHLLWSLQNGTQDCSWTSSASDSDAVIK